MSKKKKMNIDAMWFFKRLEIENGELFLQLRNNEELRELFNRYEIIHEENPPVETAVKVNFDAYFKADPDLPTPVSKPTSKKKRK